MHVLRSILVLPLIFGVFAIGALAVIVLTLVTVGLATDFIICNVGWYAGRAVLWLVGVRLEIIHYNPMPLPPAVFMLNHASTLDLFVIISLGLRKIRFIAKSEIQYNPFFFIMTRLTGQYFVDRGNSAKAVETLRKAARNLKEKQLSVMLAPEGTRTHKERVGAFKKGGFRLALEMEYPIIPVFIEGAFEINPGSSLITKPGVVRAHILNPINTNNWSRNGLDSHIAEVRQMFSDWVANPPSPDSPKTKKAG